MIKIIFATLGSFFLLVIGYLVFIYFFTKSPKPIMEYEFTKMTYSILEDKISQITTNKLNAEYNLNQKELLNKNTTTIREIVLGKDSIRFGFVTYIDKGYEFKTKKNHSSNTFPWLELLGIFDSKGKYILISRKERDEHPELIKLFEDEFIKKLNNGKVETIERSFWEWF